MIHIATLLDNAYSIAIYPPGTHHRAGYTRSSYLAITAGPYTADTPAHLHSFSQEAPNPEQAVQGLFVQWATATGYTEPG